MTTQEKNINFLKKNYPQLELVIRKKTSNREYKIEIEETRRDKTIKLNNQYIHSKYDPTKESEKLVKNIKQDIDTVIIFGVGLFYIPQYIVKTLPSLKIIIIEPSFEIFKNAIKEIEISEYFSNSNILLHFANTEYDYRNIIAKIGSTKIETIINPTYQKIFSEETKTLKKVINLYINTETVNKNTLKKYGEKSARNIFNNLKNIEKFSPISSLKPILKNKEILIISAGPTLDKQINFIKTIKNKYIIISVDTALRRLEKEKIRPDFVITGDMQYINSLHLNDCNTKKINLITSLCIDTNIISKNYKNIFLYHGNTKLEKEIASIDKKFEYIGSGGTVSSAALEIALFCECSKIYLIGLDLSYPNYQTHCKESTFENIHLNKNTKLNNIETKNFLNFKSNIIEYKNNYKNLPTPTDKRFSIYRKWFSNKAEINKNIFITSQEITKIENIEYQYPPTKDCIKDINLTKIETYKFSLKKIKDNISKKLNKLERELSNNNTVNIVNEFEELLFYQKYNIEDCNSEKEKIEIIEKTIKKYNKLLNKLTN